MLRIRIILFIGMLVSALGVNCHAASNLIQNPSFEDDWENWERYWFGSKASISSDEANTGDNSLRMDLSDSTVVQARIIQNVKLSPNTNYIFSVYAKAVEREAGSQWAGVNVNRSIPTNQLQIRIPNTSTEWTRYEMAFNSGGNTEMYVILEGADFTGQGSGDIFFDDVEIARAEDFPRPGWIDKMMSDPGPEWDEWRNALRPDGQPAFPLELSVESETDYVIILPEDATRQERRAAGELALWLGEITGAEFPVMADTAPERARELSVGRTTRVTDAVLSKLEEVEPEGYVIAIQNERVLLLGSGPSGPLHAVFALLEEDLGVRWYAPEIHDVPFDELTRALNQRPWAAGDYRVSRSSSLSASIVPRSVKPSYPVRFFVHRFAYNPWGLRNRINGSYAHQYGQHGYDGAFFVHTFHRLVPPDRYFEDNPEYFGLIEGKRSWQRGQLCLSNPDVAAAAAETAIDALRRSPRRLLSVSPLDRLGDCECDDCREIERQKGAYSGLLLQFVNRIAEIVEEEFPDATITTLAYRQSKMPPTADMAARDNVAIRFCTDFGSTFNWPYHSFYDERLAGQKELFAAWEEISRRMHLWIYPHLYTNPLAPQPTIRAVAENIRFFSERQAESVFIEQSPAQDRGRAAMRYWIFSKLMWNPDLNVEDLIRDFIWGYYGEAAPDVVRYHELLWGHNVKYTDFNRERNWINPIHDEELYRHGFVEEARDILVRALNAAESDKIRKRVELLKVGVVYVEAVQLYMQMRVGETPPDIDRYDAVKAELALMCERLGIETVAFFDGVRRINSVDEWVVEMDKERDIRLGRGYLPPEVWGSWTFRRDPDNRGIEEGWHLSGPDENENWTPVEVPAFLAQTDVGEYLGYGFYRTTFRIPDEHRGKPAEFHFGGVDEQAWVYVNGQYVGEHSLESEFMEGQEITVGDLWDRPFIIEVESEHLKPGDNVLIVRMHASRYNAGIHQPVSVYIRDWD